MLLHTRAGPAKPYLIGSPAIVAVLERLMIRAPAFPPVTTFAL